MEKPDSSIFENAVFVKSPRSGKQNCIEVAKAKGHYGVRDSKNPNGPVLVFTPDEWNAFTGGVKDGFFETL